MKTFLRYFVYFMALCIGMYFGFNAKSPWDLVIYPLIFVLGYLSYDILKYMRIKFPEEETEEEIIDIKNGNKTNKRRSK